MRKERKILRGDLGKPDRMEGPQLAVRIDGSVTEEEGAWPFSQSLGPEKLGDAVGM